MNKRRREPSSPCRFPTVCKSVPSTHKLDASLGQESDCGSFDFDLLRLWIKTCEVEHKSTCEQYEADGNGTERMKIQLIDVRLRCLVSSSTAARYLALSYVWGGVDQLRTTTESWKTLSQPQALHDRREDLPHAINDAIFLTQNLGERYLWVDTLCIFQDDECARHHQISRMNEIYQSAFATIIAASGSNANSCLGGRGLSTQRSAARTTQLFRLRDCDSIIQKLYQSVYCSRGWTFQEHLLSRRGLIFLDGEIYFQCQSELWGEEKATLNLMDWNPCYLYSGAEKTLNKLSGLSGWKYAIRTRPWTDVFGFYTELVSEYSWKQFSYPSDIIRAFGGILRVLEAHLDVQFVHGVPIQLIECALLWTPYNGYTRRQSHKTDIETLPSWSWAAWTGGVTFGLVFDPAFRNIRIRRSRINSFAIGLQSSSSTEYDFVPRTFVSLEASKQPTLTSSLNALGPGPRRSPGPKGSHLVLTTLRFRAEAVKAQQFDFELAEPFSPIDFPHITLNPQGRRMQDGIWIRTTHNTPQDVGFLYGLSTEELEKAQQSPTLFALMSEASEFDIPIAISTMDRPSESPKSTFERLIKWKRSNKAVSSHACRPPPLNDRAVLDIYFIMLLVDVGSGVFERVAVGQISMDSWGQAQPFEQEIQLV